MLAQEDPEITYFHGHSESTPLYTAISSEELIAEQLALAQQTIEGPHREGQERQRHRDDGNTTKDVTTCPS